MRLRVLPFGYTSVYLEEHAAEDDGTSVDRLPALDLTHECPFCGSSEHGRLRAPPPHFASRSHRGTLTATAIGRSPVGVDIESIARVASASVLPVLLHAFESDAAPPAQPRAIAELWSAKEAVLKLAGVGLTVEPSMLRLARSAEGFTLMEWPDSLALSDRVRIRLFPVDDDTVGALARQTDADIR